MAKASKSRHPQKFHVKATPAEMKENMDPAGGMAAVTVKTEKKRTILVA
jgi:hypothetical protein